MNTCYVNGKKYQFPDNASISIDNGNVKVKSIGNASGKKEVAPMSALKGVFDIFK